MTAQSSTHDRWRGQAPVLATTAVLLAVPLVVGDSRTHIGIATSMVLSALYALGFNIVFGLTGQLLLSVGALGAVGGYGTVLLADRLGLPLVAAWLLGATLAALLGAAFSWVAVRRSLDVLFTGIVTLAFALSLDNLLLGLRGTTGGEDGLRLEAVRGTFLDDRVGGYLASVVLLGCGLAVFRWLERSHHGWAFRALRDDEQTAALAGVDVGRQRLLASAIGAGIIGAAGGAFALVEGRVTPGSYGFAAVDVSALLAVAVGGVGTLLAPVVGAVSLGLLDELLLRRLGPVRVAVEGVILITLFLTLRGGLVGLAGRWRRRPVGGDPGRP